MSDTLPNFNITKTPQAISALTSGAVPAGAAFRIQNVGGAQIKLCISATLPDKTSYKILFAGGYGGEREVAAGENDVWLWTDYDVSTANAELA